MGLTKIQVRKASQDVEMTGQRFSLFGLCWHRQSSGGVVAAGKRRVAHQQAALSDGHCSIAMATLN